MGAASQLLVLPRVFPVSRVVIHGSAGEDAPRAYIERIGSQVAGSRPYIQGDPWRHIHWRNTARAPQPQVKEFERADTATLVVAFDASPDAMGGGEALEDAVRIAASVGHHVCRLGGVARLLAGEVDVETGSARVLLEELALLDPARNRSWYELLDRLPGAPDMVAILGEWDTQGVQAIFSLARSSGRIVAFVLTDSRPGYAGQDAVRKLRGAGATVVECRPGEVAGALSVVEGGLPAGSPANRAAPLP